MDPAVSPVAMDEAPAAAANGNGNGVHVNGETNGHVENGAPAAEEPPKTYDDLFPSLPAGKPAGGAGGGNPLGEWNRKPKVAATIVTQVFVIPMEERRNNMGTSGFGSDESHKHLKAVQDRTGAKIEMSSSKDQSLTFLITGKQDTVLKARRELLKEFQTQTNQTIAIPKEHHKFILGKGGVKLQELEQKTATKISIPKMADNLNEVTITGTKEGIEKAIRELRIVSDEQSKQAYEVLTIPKNFHPFIQGPGGENIKRITNGLASVKVNIPPLSVMKDEISVSGEKDAVTAVVALIKKDFKSMERKFSDISVEVKKSQHKYVIGPKGNSINEILADTGVFVEMPPSDSNSETITLRGPQEKLGLALTKVYEKANSVVKYEVNCPSWIHKYIIGKRGVSIQKLTNELTKVHVDFVDSNNTIKIEGPTEEVEKAREALEGQANNLIATMAYAEINVDAKYHKHIIGKGGSTVNKIKQETDVVINIPDNDHGNNVIRIEGNKQGVAKAKKELEGLVSKMENEREKDLIVESRFHRALIGPKGENISKLRDDFGEVQISFPDLGSKSEIVKLRGPKDDVDKVSKILTKRIKELQESSYQERVPIFKEFHKYIIGKGGATIRKIRTETETRVDLPESGSESDVIVITGKKENVIKASKMLQQIQNDNIDVVSKDISIPAKIHNTMIGSGGKLIQSVMRECGNVSIKFPKPESKSDTVTIRGPKEDVEKAVERLTAMSTDKQLSSMTAEVRAKPEHHKFLIGRNGANVQSIRDKTGARIIFPDEKDTDRELITILGTKESVAAAKTELEARIKGLDNVVEEQMTVDPKYHKHFVARRGEVLRQIGEEFGGVIVSFPRSGVDSDKVTLKGAKNCVEEAKARISEIVNDLINQITIECIIDQVHHRTVMGARGSKVQKICADFNVNIKIPDRNAGANGEVDSNGVPVANVIRVSGQKDKAEAAKQALIDLVPVDEEIEVAFEFHRYIIGAKGAEVRALMDRFDVNIKVPPSDQQSNTIIVSGAPKNIEAAKEGIKEKVVELEKEKADRALKSFEVKFEVDPEYHPKIIGRRGAVITQLRKDFDVNVQLPKKGDPDESILTVIGLESDAIKAKEAILKIVHEYESMTREDVEIDARVHSMLIGRRGQGIRKIMTDFKVDIKFPREGEDNPNLVVISGDEDAVLDCKDHLLNLEEEYLQDVQDREWMEEYTKPTSKQPQQGNNNNKQKGFEIKGAPWQGASDEAFPTLGGAGGAGGSAAPSAPAWGPRR